ncbi:YeeE/YedE family protein [Acidisoma sp. S159]|uniref:YeeE/YedE family protein n=1 Tax=Acidisoma sp. S159 TaxID=1747225 RepID=UPI00131A9EDC|nr:YeeE/YedE family protein [Acidisoma sp. S159]
MQSVPPYWMSLVGGMLIGTSASILLLSAGRIAGVSGIAARMLTKPDSETGWRLAFLIGLIVGPVAFTRITGHVPALRIAASLPVLVLAGLLVGFGTRLGSGCTSGHGVVGLARLSPRSMSAVATFLAIAMLTVFLVRHGEGFL